MSEAKLDFSSNSEEAQRSIDKLTKKTAELTESLRKMKAQGVQGAKESAQAQVGLLGSLSATAAKVTSLGAIVADVYGGWQTRLDQLKQSHKDLMPNLSKGLAESGRLDKAPELQEWMGQLQKSGVTREHAIAAFTGTAAAGELSLVDQKAIAGEAATFGPTKMDVGRLGGLMAEIKKVAPEMSADDLADTAMSMKKQLGSKADSFGSDAFQRQMADLKDSGMRSKDVITAAIAALGRDQKGNALELLTKKRLNREQRQDKERIFGASILAEIGALTESDRQTNFGALQRSALPGAMQSADAVARAKDIASAKLGPAETALENVQAAKLEGAAARGGFSNRTQTLLDPIHRKIDALLRFVGLETTESQATSLARAGERSGQLAKGEPDKLLAELQEQTKLMKEEARNKPQPRIPADAHTESGAR